MAEMLIETGYTEPKTAAEKTRVILELLRHRHSGQEWATFVELNTGTGAYAGRRIDFYAFNLWPSKGYLKIAYEVKVSRSDFFREIEDPKKREPAEKVSDEAYFVTPVGLVQPDEVPEGWGLLELVSNGLRRKKVARQRKVKELPLHFVAALARQSSLPEPHFPAATWLLAGQELTEEDLIAAATETMAIHEYSVYESARRDLRQTGEYKTLERIRDLIGSRIGWNYSRDPKLFSLWLDKNGGKVNGAPVLDTYVREELAHVYAVLGKVLEKDRRIAEMCNSYDYDGEVWLEDENYVAEWGEEGDAPFLEDDRRDDDGEYGRFVADQMED